MVKHTKIVRFKVPRCIRTRHWFTYYGAPGSVSPICRHCSAPNPYMTDEELSEMDDAERSVYAAGLEAFSISLPTEANT